MAVLGTSAGNIKRWLTSTDYLVGDVVYNPDNYRIYLCIRDHLSTSFIADYALGDWQELAIANEPWVAGKQLYAGRTYYNGTLNGVQLYVAVANYVAGASILADIAAGSLRPLTNYQISPWISGYGYYIGYTVTDSDLIYKCIINHVAGADFQADLIAGNWIQIGGGASSKFSIPNNQTTPIDVTGLSFDSNLYTKIKLEVSSSRVSTTQTNLCDYSVLLNWVGGSWVISPSSYNSSLGGYDGVSWLVSTVGTVGQVQITSDLVTGTYDINESNFAYSMVVKA